MSKKLLTLFALLFAWGTIDGYRFYRNHMHDTAKHIAGINATPAHIIVAFILVGGAIVGYILTRNRTFPPVNDGSPVGYAGFWKLPFSKYTEKLLLHSVTAIVFSFVGFLLSFIGLGAVAQKLELWQMTHVLRTDGEPKNRHYFRALGHFAWGVLVSLVLFICSSEILYSFYRAGQQVFKQLDQAFVVNAWGGPTAVGASVGHWMDGILFLYMAVIVMRWLMRCQSRAVFTDHHN